MLSVLIPVYNFDVVLFVKDLAKQCADCKIDFEVLCLDDYSSENYRIKNAVLKSIENVCYEELPNNIGRSKIRNRLAEKAGVPCVPYVLTKIDSYEDLNKKSKHLGKDLVIQLPYGDSGHTTFFIKEEKEYDKHAEEIEGEKEVKVMKRINCRGAAIEACVTRHGTVVAPLMTELVGFKELTPYKGGWCGNEIYANAFTKSIRTKARRYTRLFGDQLREEGYKGYF